MDKMEILSKNYYLYLAWILGDIGIMLIRGAGFLLRFAAFLSYFLGQIPGLTAVLRLFGRGAGLVVSGKMFDFD